MENLSESDRPQVMEYHLTRPRTSMQDNLSPRFAQAVLSLVTWFLGAENHFDAEILRTTVEKVLAENSKMSDLALQTAIRKQYAREIYAVVQLPAVALNSGKYVTRYEFAPLTGPSEIRFFKFRKFVTLGTQVYFSCDIVHANLDDQPWYSALSYVWGPLDDVVPVLVGEDKYIMVTKNLMEVLFRFSGANTPTDTGNTKSLVWTDQLCINQYDAEERGKQVALMRRLYSQAGETNLWLGEEDKVSQQAFELVRCFECIETGSSDPTLFMLAGLDPEDIRRRFFARFPHAVDSIPPKTDPRWKALYLLLNRPWFSRLWVFQEAILSSSNAMCSAVSGQQGCSFFHLFLARSLLFVDWDFESLPHGMQMVKHLMQFYVYRSLECLPPISFTVWQIGGSLRSGDPRDRIYGLLGVQNPNNEIDFPIDYKKSVQDVYIDFTRCCIEKDKSLRVFQFIKESQTKEIPNLPSWVPDWSIGATTDPLEGSKFGDGRESRFNACANFRHVQMPPESTSSRVSLAVKGKIIDHIRDEMPHDPQIGAPVQIEEYFSINFLVEHWTGPAPRIRDLLRCLTRSLHRDIASQDRAHHYSRRIQRPIVTQSLISTSARLSDEDALAIYHELEHLRELYFNALPHDGSNKDLQRKLWLNTEVCRGRILAVLLDHWIMLGPREARKGDRIAILHGSSVPLVLRACVEAGQDEYEYEVVGQRFVDGVMHGEAVNWNEDSADTFLLV